MASMAFGNATLIGVFGCGELRSSWPVASPTSAKPKSPPVLCFERTEIMSQLSAFDGCPAVVPNLGRPRSIANYKNIACSGDAWKKQLCMVKTRFPLASGETIPPGGPKKLFCNPLAINELHLLSTLNIVTIIVCIDAECRHWHRSAGLVKIATSANFCELSGHFFATRRRCGLLCQLAVLAEKTAFCCEWAPFIWWPAGSPIHSKQLPWMAGK